MPKMYKLCNNKKFCRKDHFSSTSFHFIGGAAKRWIFRDPFRGKGETLGFGRERGNFHEEAEEEKKEAEEEGRSFGGNSQQQWDRWSGTG